MSRSRTGGKLLADQLVLHGCELAFCVPGESYLALLDGLYDRRDRLRVVTCRHEASAANAAEAAGKLTGRPGVCMVTRGPGAAHAAVGVHTARRDSTPLILLVGPQERRFPARAIGTDLVNPDFAALARAYGVHAERVEHTGQFAGALVRAREAGGPALIELITDPETLTPTASLSDTRAQAASRA